MLDDLLRTTGPAAVQQQPPPIGVGARPPSSAPPPLLVTLAAPPPSRPATAPPVPLVIAQPGPMAIVHPGPTAIAELVRLPRPPVPSFSSIATTMRRLTGAFAVHRRDRVRRLTYVLGALVIAGAVTAIAIVLSRDRSGPVEARVSYPKIAAASRRRCVSSHSACA